MHCYEKSDELCVNFENYGLDNLIDISSEIKDEEFEEINLKDVKLEEIVEDFNINELHEILLKDDQLILSCNGGGSVLMSNSFNITYKNHIFENISVESLHKFADLLLNHVLFRKALEDIWKNYEKEFLNIMPIQSKELLLKYYYYIHKYNLLNGNLC